MCIVLSLNKMLSISTKATAIWKEICDVLGLELICSDSMVRIKKVNNLVSNCVCTKC